METKYNILFTLNSSYFTYGKLFINSLYDNNDMNKVDTVYLADTGMTPHEIKFFSNFPHIKILETRVVSDFNKGGTWGVGWSQSVISKTQSLYNILQETQIPVMMIDADCIIVKNLSSLISHEMSIQLCCRKPHHIPYLGSFVIVHPDEYGKTFVENWIMNINKTNNTKAKESPSLGLTVLENQSMKIEDIPRIKVSCYNKEEYNTSVHIIHLKGCSLSTDIEEDNRKRIYGKHGFDSLIEKYLVTDGNQYEK